MWGIENDTLSIYEIHDVILYSTDCSCHGEQTRSTTVSNSDDLNDALASHASAGVVHRMCDWMWAFVSVCDPHHSLKNLLQIDTDLTIIRVYVMTSEH